MTNDRPQGASTERVVDYPLYKCDGVQGFCYRSAVTRLLKSGSGGVLAFESVGQGMIGCIFVVAVVGGPTVLSYS